MRDVCKSLSKTNVAADVSRRHLDGSSVLWRELTFGICLAMGSAPASGAANGALAVRTCAYNPRGSDTRTPFVRREARRTAAEGGRPPHC